MAATLRVVAASSKRGYLFVNRADMTLRCDSEQELGSNLALFCAANRIEPEDVVVLVEAPVPMTKIAVDKARLLLGGIYKNTFLTKREFEVLARVNRGLSNKEIAAELNIGVRTAKYHLSSLLAKYHVSKRALLPLVPKNTFKLNTVKENK